ncbi:MAG: glutathione S-transferase family protein [Alphaproteobacteria bacterium]|nr:glutathione S-transferase family protein [Alphaproteobacteria bacterium]
MLTLFTNGFSPFARKVAMALEYKSLAYESVDGLTHANRERLLAVNPRAEVPVLVDGDITVVNSSDIVGYLDQKYPERPIYPADLKARVEARALERLADSRIDAIMLDCSIWTWADRKDPPLPGLKESGQRDLDAIFARIETSLQSYATPWPFGHLTIAEFALWPHLAALRPLGFTLDAEKYPRLAAWFAAMRRDRIFLDDARRTADFMKTIGTTAEFEREKIFWRGDRIEWLLARGFHDWFWGEIKAGRAIWPE